MKHFAPQFLENLKLHLTKMYALTYILLYPITQHWLRLLVLSAGFVFELSIIIKYVTGVSQK